MLTTIIALLLCFTSSSTTAQAPYDLHKNCVIAESGLRVRASPSFTGKVIGGVGYEARVTVLPEAPFVHDTLGYRGWVQYDEESGQPHLISEYWVPIDWRGGVGYVFGAYLGYDHPIRKEAGYSPENRDFRLLFPRAHCVANRPRTSDYFWTGFYADGERTWRQAVEPAFVYTTAYELTPFVTYTNDDRHLRFLIGSPSPLPGGPVVNRLPDNAPFDLFDCLTPTETARLGTYQLTVDQQPSGTSCYTLLYHLEESGRRRLNPPHYAARIDWIGDLDADGFLDYLVWFGDGESTPAVLYLGQADGRVRRLASWAAGPCC